MAPWDGSGNVTRTNGTNSGQSVWQEDRDDGVNIRADRHDTHDEDLANSLENTVALDGQNTTTTDNAIIRYSTGTDNKFVEVTIAANQVPMRVGTGNLSGFTVGTNTLVGRKAGNIEAIAIGTASGEIPLADDVLKADPEHATDSGTDAYVSATNTTPPADGVQIVRDFQSSSTTTTPTLDGKTVTDRDGNALWASAISGPHTLQRDQTADTYLLLDPLPSILGDPVARLDKFTAGHIDGLELSNNGTDADHDIDIATGVCSMRDGSGNRKLFELTATLTKQIDANWAEGTAAGGFPSGFTLSADTWYRVFLIGKGDGTVDAGFDTDASATNLLADATGYSWFRQIRWHRVDSSTNITNTIQRGDYVYFTAGYNRDFKQGNPGTSAVTAAMLVPPDEIGMFMFALHDSTTGGGFTSMLVMGGGQTMSAPDVDNFDLQTSSANGDIRTQTMKMLKVNASSQIQYRLNISTADHVVYGFSNGWIDSRGRDN